ncbi:ATP-binding protein [Vibrio splendidus]|uniref:ATP-binding protein n=1 Tax=Vibrio splendidus TaxID=29497 RepID=UPI00352BDE1A
MKIKVTYDSLFVYSEGNSLCFFESFSKGVNLISGRNTSGKSTLMQSILYSFGVNDVKDTLHEILSYNPIFKLDFTKEWGVLRNVTQL